jgi:hypothetical protein
MTKNERAYVLSEIDGFRTDTALGSTRMREESLPFVYMLGTECNWFKVSGTLYYIYAGCEH